MFSAATTFDCVLGRTAAVVELLSRGLVLQVLVRGAPMISTR